MNKNSLRTALITGAGRGIGRGIALALSHSGFSLAINYASNVEAAEQTAKLCQNLAQNSSQEFITVKGDVSDRDDRKALIDAAFSKWGHLDVLVNNAGVAPQVRADILEESEESFDRLISINLKGSYFLTRELALRWEEEGYPEKGSIVFITSISADTVSTSRGGYCISKAGASMAASLWAVRTAKSGVGVFEIRPGIIETDMTAEVLDKYSPLLDNGQVPAGRFGRPEDIGKLVAALASGELSYASGSVIVAGGAMGVKTL